MEVSLDFHSYTVFIESMGCNGMGSVALGPIKKYESGAGLFDGTFPLQEKLDSLLNQRILSSKLYCILC